MNHRKCPNLTVLMDGSVVVVVIPLREYFGLVTYDKNNGNYFTFRENMLLIFPIWTCAARFQQYLSTLLQGLLS